MPLRFAFAISTSVKADILLMDEWLSVGDASFFRKAQDRLQQLVRGVEILVCSPRTTKV